MVELVVALAILAVLMSIAIPIYEGYVDRARVAKAATEIAEISIICERFFTENSRYPNDLDEVGQGARRDPWDNPYQYLNIENGGPGTQGRVRKDKNLVPVNSDFDLYSMGPDGASRPPFTARASRDDIVRAGNGGFIGIADEY